MPALCMMRMGGVLISGGPMQTIVVKVPDELYESMECRASKARCTVQHLASLWLAEVELRRGFADIESATGQAIGDGYGDLPASEAD